MTQLTDKQERLCETSEWDFSDLKALYINCTLKRSPEPSHTQGLADRSIAVMRKVGVQVDVVRAIDKRIPATLYDTTLRDGTQGTGISFSVLDKIRVAEKLDAFGIDYIEGGWPGSNPKDAAFFEQAAEREWKHAKIAAFGMTRRGRMKVEEDSQVQMLLAARTPVVTIVGKTWPLHVAEVFGVSLEENLAMIGDTVRFLKEHGKEVFYDAEHFFDSFREDAEYSLATIKAAHEAGADLIVLCDTNGGSLPDFVGEATGRAVSHLNSPVGIHTHNDGGLGVANTLIAIKAGAVQVQGTMNGYGERVGNCNLTTLIPTLQLKLGVNVVPDMTMLREVAVFVDELANVPHDIRAPYVGVAAFTHKGGLHVHAVQKLARTYEHVDPTLVGNRQTIVVSDMSGQTNVLMKARDFGLELDKGSPEVARILRQIKDAEAQGYEYEAAEGSFEAACVRKASWQIPTALRSEGISLPLPLHGSSWLGPVRGNCQTAGRRRSRIHRRRGRRTRKCTRRSFEEGP